MTNWPKIDYSAKGQQVSILSVKNDFLWGGAIFLYLYLLFVTLVNGSLNGMPQTLNQNQFKDWSTNLKLQIAPPAIHLQKYNAPTVSTSWSQISHCLQQGSRQRIIQVDGWTCVFCVAIEICLDSQPVGLESRHISIQQ